MINYQKNIANEAAKAQRTAKLLAEAKSIEAQNAAVAAMNPRGKLRDRLNLNGSLMNLR